MLRRFVACTLLTVPILALTPEVQDLFGVTLGLPFEDVLLLVLSTIVFAYGGWPFLAGLVKELRARLPGMMTLIGLAISAAYAYSAASVLTAGGTVFFWELATLIDIMLLGHYLEMRSVQGASRALEELARVLPSEAEVVRDGQLVRVGVEQLRPGDDVLVRPGSKVPADGRVVKGESDVDESLLTGESRPVPKATGDEIIGGSLNGEGSLTVQVTRTGAETYLSQVIDLVRRAQESRSRSQDIADRAALVLTVIALVSGALTLTAWLFAGETAGFAVERAVTVMVICCPHALALAIPLVVAISTVLAARSGFLVRRGTPSSAPGTWTSWCSTRPALSPRAASGSSRSLHPLGSRRTRRCASPPRLSPARNIPSPGASWPRPARGSWRSPRQARSAPCRGRGPGPLWTAGRT